MNALKTGIASILAAGLFSAAATAQTSATIATTPAVADTGAVGISSRDGISVSGADVLVTRNGVTEKLTKELSLPNGFRVALDGSVTTAEGSKFTLRDTQILTFDGKLLDPRKPDASSTTTTTTTSVATPLPAAAAAPTAGPAAAEIANSEADRRAKAAAAGESPAKSGDSPAK